MKDNIFKLLYQYATLFNEFEGDKETRLDILDDMINIENMINICYGVSVKAVGKNFMISGLTFYKDNAIICEVKVNTVC